MFFAPGKIQTRDTGTRQDLVLSHPVATIIFERPSGTAWFSSQEDKDALVRAERLKAIWETNSNSEGSRFVTQIYA